MQLSDEVGGVSWAFGRYESVRAALPSAEFPRQPQAIADLSALGDRIDTFLLDAFGVLNVGETAIPSAVERMADLRGAGKRLLVLSNSASQPTCVTAAKFRTLGFDFTDDEVVTSRDALKIGLREQPSIRWGVAGMRNSDIDELGVDAVLLEDDLAVYRDVQGFILLSSGEWSSARQKLLADALAENVRPVLVGNPDIVAPRETGLSLEPGHFAHNLAVATGIAPVFYGKPFSNIFMVAQDRLGGMELERTAMVGDTLHTDVLGGAAAGMKTVLVADHGLFAGTEVGSYIQGSSIVPDYISRTT